MGWNDKNGNLKGRSHTKWAKCQNCLSLNMRGISIDTHTVVCVCVVWYVLHYVCLYAADRSQIRC